MNGKIYKGYASSFCSFLLMACSDDESANNNQGNKAVNRSQNTDNGDANEKEAVHSFED
ncbi:hypothetical protein [Pseudogracilibacillus sp. SO30301A]|uniref:hypothetical protein n=1 Tax=Pseudogracilibacillus sp. SO30301A TaxID=3098291 RepID=UPI00300E6DF1